MLPRSGPRHLLREQGAVWKERNRQTGPNGGDKASGGSRATWEVNRGSPDTPDVPGNRGVHAEDMGERQGRGSPPRGPLTPPRADSSALLPAAATRREGSEWRRLVAPSACFKRTNYTTRNLEHLQGSKQATDHITSNPFTQYRTSLFHSERNSLAIRKCAHEILLR